MATKLLLQIARDKGYVPPTEVSASMGTGSDRSLSRAGSVRLRDAVVWGYMMQRNACRGQVSVLTGAIMHADLYDLQSCHRVEAEVGVCTGTQQDLRACPCLSRPSSSKGCSSPDWFDHARSTCIPHMAALDSTADQLLDA